MVPAKRGGHDPFSNDMMALHRGAFDDFDKMHGQMMQGFPKMDMGKFLEHVSENSHIFSGFPDPFANDPFFANSGFGSMSKMMSGMREQMNQMMQGAMDGGNGSSTMMSFSGGPGNGKFMKQSFVQSTKIGPDGKPMHERYQTKAHGAMGPGGKKITER